MPRILTITANTAIDYFLEVDYLTTGDNILAKSSAEFAAGKGINVAKAVESLQSQVTTLGFVGNQSLSVFDAIESKFLKTDFTTAEGKTRSNTTLADTSQHQETHIRTQGFHVTSADCNRLTAMIERHIKTDDIVVLSGSLPPGAPKNLYQKWIALCHDKQALAFLDTSGESLAQGLQSLPYLIKPNLKELEDFMGRNLSNEKAIVSAAREINKLGVQCVVVSRGKQGIIVVTDEVSLAANIEHVSKKIISTIGSGDALVGGLAVAMLCKNPLLEVIKSGISCATANLFSSEPGRFDPLLAETLQKHIVIRPL